MSTAHHEAPTLIQESTAPDGLAGELLARRRKRLPLLTLALIVLAAAAAAFIGGVEAQKHWGKSNTASSGLPSAAAAAFAGRGFPGGTSSPAGAGGFPGFGGANATTGTVTLIKGTTIYVTNAAGKHRPRQDLCALAGQQVRFRVGEDDPPRRQRHRHRQPEQGRQRQRTPGHDRRHKWLGA